MCSNLHQRKDDGPPKMSLLDLLEQTEPHLIIVCVAGVASSLSESEITIMSPGSWEDDLGLWAL